MYINFIFISEAIRSNVTRYFQKNVHNKFFFFFALSVFDPRLLTFDVFIPRVERERERKRESLTYKNFFFLNVQTLRSTEIEAHSRRVTDK